MERAIQTISEGQFKSEGAKGASGKWKPLTRKYAIWKAQKYGARLILQRTQALYKAMTGHTGDTITVKEKDEFGYGTSLFYQPYVNKERPIVNLSNADRNFMQKETQKGLLRQMKGDTAITSFLDVQD